MSAHRSPARVSTPLDRVAGAATPSLIVPALGALILLAVAGATGKLTALVEHLPLGHQPNGFTLFCLLAMAAFTWWLIRRHDRLYGEDFFDPAVGRFDVERLDSDKWPVRS